VFWCPHHTQTAESVEKKEKEVAQNVERSTKHVSPAEPQVEGQSLEAEPTSNPLMVIFVSRTVERCLWLTPVLVEIRRSSLVSTISSVPNAIVVYRLLTRFGSHRALLDHLSGLGWLSMKVAPLVSQCRPLVGYNGFGRRVSCSGTEAERLVLIRTTAWLDRRGRLAGISTAGTSID
jgi:hypothetical protein